MYDIFTTATPEVERDKELYKKHTYTYDLLKSRYPEIHKLPDNEVDEMAGILRHKGEGYDDALPYLDDYISKHEPEWKSKYLGEKPKSEINGNKKGFGDYSAKDIKKQL